uniref:Transmembrane protein 72 n=1 Tax=Cyclopterus lumpus TaxID=8103 RepID=A0A8C2WED7_CYCLU
TKSDIWWTESTHHSLGIYLICPPDWQLFVLWGKMARIGGFHKFLYYSIMSVVCFLHPVLVWHAIIPGTMLLVTAFLNFILSKKTTIKSPKRPQESHSDQGLTTICVTEGTPSNSTVSFLHVVTGRRGGGQALATRGRCLGLGERGESVQAMLELEQTIAPKGTDRERRRWKERRLICLRGREEPVEREMEEMDSYCEPEPDTTSDTTKLLTDITQRKACVMYSYGLAGAVVDVKHTHNIIKCPSSQNSIFGCSVIMYSVF